LTIEDRFKVRRPQDQATELPNSLPRESRGGFQEQGYYTALQVFDKKTAKGDKPEGIVIVDDLMTRGAIAAFQKMNLRLGTDIKIATHANKDSPALLGYESDLILLEMDVAELVDGLYEMLEARIEGRPVPAAQLNVAPKVKGPS
jgi:DNA-binding LacI/PurR family transcriptional regulator